MGRERGWDAVDGAAWMGVSGGFHEIYNFRGAFPTGSSWRRFVLGEEGV